MDLETFITESLKQIITGEKEAQKFASEHGTKINHKSQQRSEGGISIAKIDRDISKENFQQSTHQNRIQFSVSVRFPIQETQEELKIIEKNKPSPYVRTQLKSTRNAPKDIFKKVVL
jgi:hypothetical protein